MFSKGRERVQEQMGQYIQYRLWTPNFNSFCCYSLFQQLKKQFSSYFSNYIYVGISGLRKVRASNFAKSKEGKSCSSTVKNKTSKIKNTSSKQHQSYKHATPLASLCITYCSPFVTLFCISPAFPLGKEFCINDFV